MAIGISEVAFFAPLTLGVSVLVASNISNAMIAHSEHTSEIQDRARAVKKEIDKSDITVDDVVEHLRVHQQPEDQDPATILDDLWAKDINRDLFEAKIKIDGFVWGWFSPITLNEHRSRSVNRSAYASACMLAVVFVEVINSLCKWMKVEPNWLVKAFDSSTFLSAHLLCLLVLVYILIRNLYSLKAASQYISILNSDLTKSKSSIRRLILQYDFLEKTQNVGR